VKRKVRSGLYNNASEVIREAMRQSLERESLFRLRASCPRHVARASCPEPFRIYSFFICVHPVRLWFVFFLHFSRVGETPAGCPDEVKERGKNGTHEREEGTAKAQRSRRDAKEEMQR